MSKSACNALVRMGSIFLLYSGRTVRDAVGKTLAFVSIKDITARKQAEQSLRQLSGRLLHAQDEERRRLAREDSSQELAQQSVRNCGHFPTCCIPPY